MSKEEGRRLTDGQELLRDIWYWLHFCLHDKDFLESLRSRYPQKAIDKELAETTCMFEEYIRAH